MLHPAAAGFGGGVTPGAEQVFGWHPRFAAFRARLYLARRPEDRLRAAGERNLGLVTAQPIEDPSDPAVILRDLPEREREEFLRQYHQAVDAAHDPAGYQRLGRTHRGGQGPTVTYRVEPLSERSSAEAGARAAQFGIRSPHGDQGGSHRFSGLPAQNVPDRRPLSVLGGAESLCASISGNRSASHLPRPPARFCATANQASHVYRQQLQPRPFGFSPLILEYLTGSMDLRAGWDRLVGPLRRLEMS
jgi:hypothetical protein